jgi:hypothetical protein
VPRTMHSGIPELVEDRVFGPPGGPGSTCGWRGVSRRLNGRMIEPENDIRTLSQPLMEFYDDLL